MIIRSAEDDKVQRGGGEKEEKEAVELVEQKKVCKVFDIVGGQRHFDASQLNSCLPVEHHKFIREIEGKSVTFERVD